MAFLTVKEVAQALRVSTGTVRRLIESQRMPGIKVGSQVRVESGELIKYIKARGNLSESVEAVPAIEQPCESK